uniref:Uncharacterized protein n=1 Tax=Molossus molossus TaxID=27622 RepID=A0A7J8GQZ0_MOLMO|nr:hypothetical protein HJG59_011378 [Molossus molossus]
MNSNLGPFGQTPGASVLCCPPLGPRDSGGTGFVSRLGGRHHAAPSGCQCPFCRPPSPAQALAARAQPRRPELREHSEVSASGHGAPHYSIGNSHPGVGAHGRPAQPTSKTRQGAAAWCPREPLAPAQKGHCGVAYPTAI